jgi:hypothetical protein
MNKLLATLIAAMFAAVTFSAIAAEQAKPVDKPAKAGKKHHKKDEVKKPEAAAPVKQ